MNFLDNFVMGISGCNIFRDFSYKHIPNNYITRFFMTLNFPGCLGMGILDFSQDKLIKKTFLACYGFL